MNPPVRFISCQWAVITKRDRENFRHISFSNRHVFLRIRDLNEKDFVVDPGVDARIILNWF